ncbi:MAG: MmgE/PrpD family protein, partial [Alphaproteobacteria bacterium]|nr:MmgE/PrpD family protein [Alphaproteobacteria bacterium]
TVAAAALALGEARRGSGRNLLEAFLLGVEVACRTSAALGPSSLYARGFHPTAVCGTFGAAAASAHALGLDRGGLAAALGLAFQQACGALAWVTDPTESSRPLSPALGARNGVSAALLAAACLSGPPAPFDGKHSAFIAFSGEGSPGLLLDAWGERFYIDEISHKLHASCSYSHAALDGLFALRRRHPFAAEQVEGVAIRSVPAVRSLVTDPALRSCYLPYIVSVALARGQVAIEDVAADRSAEPEIARLISCVSLIDDPTFEGGYPERCGAAIEVRLSDGAVLRDTVEAAKGTPANPLSEAEIVAKFRAAALSGLPSNAADTIADQIGHLDALADIDQIATILRYVSAQPGH